MPESKMQPLWAELAWLPSGWARQVLLQAGPDGRWATIESGVDLPDGAMRVATLLPGMVDAHSHAFQRAFAGLAERRETEVDTFWTWRDRMYQVASRITHEQLRAVAALLYLELLRGGYTQVCEFHYVHHTPSGAPYADPLTLSWMLVEAAQDTGIGLTVLPALYERAGFSKPTLHSGQLRFASDLQWVWKAAQRINAAGFHEVNAGVAIHSLRAAREESIISLQSLLGDWNGPVHIHVSEQESEVKECLAATGHRPIAWLAAHKLLDERWNLVHATRTEALELDYVASSGAAIVLCPTTEANLGDGSPDVMGMLTRDIHWSIGSDSNIGRDWREELRWLEYAQRLQQHRRMVVADPARGEPSAANCLFSGAQSGAAQANGQSLWGFQPGARADALVVSEQDTSSIGVCAEQAMDALVFSSPARTFDDVMVAGRWVIRKGEHRLEKAIRTSFTRAMEALFNQTI